MNNDDERDYAEEAYNRELLENPDPTPEALQGIWLTMDQLRSWAGLHRDLTPDELDQLDDCIPNSSIPDAIGTIVNDAMGIIEPDPYDWEGNEPESADGEAADDVADEIALNRSESSACDGN